MLDALTGLLFFLLPQFTTMPIATTTRPQVLSAKAIKVSTIRSTPTVIPPTITPTIFIPKPTRNVTTTTTSWQATMMQQINIYRQTKGLGPVENTHSACSFAQIRAQEITGDFNHNGFRQRINMKTLPYVSWSEVTENIAQDQNYAEIVSLWIQSPGHEANLRKDTPFVCIGKSGDYYAYEGWKP